MKLRSAIYIFIIAYGILSVTSIHRDGNQSQQLQALKNKQKYLGQQVASINQNSASVKSRLQNASSDKQRVQILQSTLRDQRQQIFDLKNRIIYPFNQSQTACQQLSEKQKEVLLQKIQITRNKLKELQTMNSKLNHSLTRVRDMDRTIQKQYIILQNMEDILRVKCKQNLSPTIFQSNLNAKNWILGPQTMNDLQQQYAQRALIFHNITNCPLQNPFFDPQVEQCIQCEQPDPIFNMYSKKCTRCDLDQQLDAEKRICRNKPHYTNFTRLVNWNLQGGKLPQINKNLTPCADSKPYFNGVICVQCDLPYYWSVSANLCKQCPEGTQFDLNTRKCQQLVRHQLTILQNTKWVSQNLTKIVQQRINVLQKNKTGQNYHYCPNINSPYYDRTTCIPCEYFDIDNYKCIAKPQGTQYDDNMKMFLPPENNKQTNINAQRYITTYKLTDSATPDCNSSFPFYDGIACIQCLKPFDIFNVDRKKCVACNGDQIFVQDLHICQPRQKIYISDNFNKLLATPKVTVADYKQFLIKNINENTQAIISPCPDKTHYSNLKQCFPCPDNQYFNVQTLKCQVCDGIYLQSTNTCKPNVYIFTNLKAGRIIDMQGKTVQGQNARISQFLQTHPDSYVCSIDTPYAIQNKTCGQCPDLFSYNQLKCKSCSQFYIYVPDTRKCQKAKMAVNFTDERKILVTPTQTLTSFKQQQNKIKTQYPTLYKVCPGDRPYTDTNRQSCFNCNDPNPYFNYTLKQCQNCPKNFIFDPVTVRCVQQFYITLFNSNTEPRMLGYENYTLSQYKIEQQQLKRTHPFVDCTPSQPFGTANGCKQCNQPTSYFDIKKKDCSNVKYLMNFEKISPEYILPKDRNLDSYIADQDKFRREATFLTTKCPDDKPYTSDRNSCFNCSTGEYFNFISKRCDKCPQGYEYVKNLKSCQKLFYVTKINDITQPNMKGYQNYTVADYKQDIKKKSPIKQCPDEAPYGTIDGCKKCQQPTPYFDVKKLICSNAKQLINFEGIGQNYILDEGKTLQDYQKNQQNFRKYSQSLTVQCPKQRPYTSDRNTCFVCKQPDYLFNFQTRRCQSCAKGTTFQQQKKRCLRAFYITNFNDDSIKKMIGTKDYKIADFRADQQKIAQQNPTVNCSAAEPYGTNNGCKKCIIPEQYFDIKNRICTSVKRLINFDAVSKDYITGKGKTLNDYHKQQDDFAANSQVPTLICPQQTPYTNTRTDCFTCKAPLIYFNFETKNCQNCSNNQVYDPKSSKCLLPAFLTDFQNPNIKQQPDFKIDDAKKIEEERANKDGYIGVKCPSDKPFATLDKCISCDQQSKPYFNIKILACQGCRQFYQRFEDKQCKENIILTNTRKMIGYFEVDNYTKYNVEKQNNFTYLMNKHVFDCPAQNPFYQQAIKSCISCNTSSQPIFDLSKKKCVSVTSLKKSNPSAFKFYIQEGGSTLAQLQGQISVLRSRGVKIDLCPSDKPYLSNYQCTICPDTQKYFNLGTQICTTCKDGDICKQV